MKNKSNAELIQLIADATAELELRRLANEQASTTDEGGEEEEGGDRPPDPKFP